MVSWLVGVVVCLALTAGCGGGPKGNLVKMEPAQEELAVPATNENLDEASLAEELSSKRLEELYAKSGIPGWDPSLEHELKQWEHQVKFDVPIQMNKQVRAYLVYFSTERKEVIRRYLARSTRYLPMIKEIFQEYGLPEDLAYLAMIESGFNNKAYSPAAASGMWQFIKGTGLRYGLAINNYVDERRDPEKATRAAAEYLLDLYKQFGSWYLAAASYNCGEGRVQRELDQSNHKNFWELSAHQCLPKETKNYVPQMIAATIIAKNPGKFGFKNVPYLPPLKFDKVQVKEATSLEAAAVAVNVPPEEVQALNPQLLRGVTPPDSPAYTLRLPANSKELFAKNITLASIDHPAVASAPVRTARHAARHTARSHSNRKSAAAPHAVLAQKTVEKKHSPERSARKSTKRTYAKRSKASHRAPAKASQPVVQASLFGTPSLGARHSEGRKTKVAHSGSSKSKGKKTGVKSRKSRETRLARKGDNNGRSSVKSRKSNGSRHSKGKYSRSRSRRTIMVSEAR